MGVQPDLWTRQYTALVLLFSLSQDIQFGRNRRLSLTFPACLYTARLKHRVTAELWDRGTAGYTGYNQQALTRITGQVSLHFILLRNKSCLCFPSVTITITL